jgi:hypothetical protein
MLTMLVELIDEYSAFQRSNPIYRKETSGGFPTTSLRSLLPHFNYTDRSRRAKKNGSGRPASTKSPLAGSWQRADVCLAQIVSAVPAM